MKLSAFVAIAAVVGGSFLIPVPADAGSCIARNAVEIEKCREEMMRSMKRGSDWKSPSDYASNRSSGNCPSGTSEYQKSALFGLVKGKTMCLSDYEAESLNAQRARDIQQNLNESFSSPRNCSGTINSWGNSGYATYNTTCY